MQHKHLGVCLKCRLCDRCSFHSIDIQKHCHDMHRDAEGDWFEPVPALEGDIVEITDSTLQANIALVKQEVITLEDDEETDL